MGTEGTVLTIIWNWGGEASISTIAKEARITPDYARLLCENLRRHDYIDLRSGRICYLKGKGKLEAAKMSVGEGSKKKVVVSKNISRFGPGKNKKGRFILNY